MLVALPAFADRFEKIHNQILDRYDVDHISAGELNHHARTDLIFFDVRKTKEYAVSHIVNAIRVDPGISAEQFFELHGELLEGKTAVFYCSVGRRSSQLLSRLDENLDEFGVDDAYNLKGGLFRWHNDKRPLVRGNDKTRNIHPYNFYWGRLIEHKEFIRYRADDE